jgi:hypothetical protein
MSRRKHFEQFEHLTTENPEYVCYLYHFDPPYIPEDAEDNPSLWAGHYLGSSPDFPGRDSKHGGPEGARLMQVQREAGGTWHLTRTWLGNREKEFQLKTRAPKAYCPDCTDHPVPGTNPPRKDARYLSRRQRRERQAQREAGAREAEPIPDRLNLRMLDITYADPQVQARREAWQKEMQARQPQLELEAGLWAR